MNLSTGNFRARLKDKELSNSFGSKFQMINNIYFKVVLRVFFKIFSSKSILNERMLKTVDSVGKFHCFNVEQIHICG